MSAGRGVAKATSETSITEVGPGIPGWALRAVVLLAGLGAVAVQADSGLELLFLVVLGLLAVLVAVVPASPAPAMLIAAVAAVAALSDADPMRPAVLVAIPLLHLVHVGSALSAIVPLRCRIQPRALLRPARRFLAVQVATFAVAGLLTLLPTSENGTLVELLALLATAALVLLTLRFLHRPERGSGEE